MSEKKQKQAKWDDLSPEQQNVIRQTIIGASDAAAAKIAQMFGYVEEESTRDCWVNVFITGPHMLNRNANVPTVLRQKAQTEIRKQIKPVVVKYKGSDYTVSATRPKVKVKKAGK